MVLKKSIKDQLLRYCYDVIQGEIVTCVKHKNCCKRFLKDVEREGTEDFPFIFDEAQAKRFLMWMVSFKHTKGVLAGKHIKPDIHTKFIVCNIYGWYHKDTGYRRFTKFYYQVGRKNAKSQLLSIIALYELCAFRPGHTMEVYCAATKKDQAKIVYDESELVLRQNEDLAGKFTVAYGKIKHNKSGSTMRALSQEDRKRGDGLNPQCGIIDEYHAHENSSMYDVIDSGMGARPEPLLAIITTAGFDLENPCYRTEYPLASNIVDPNIDIEHHSYFVMICELEKNETSETVEVKGRKVSPGDLIDDIYDEKNWIKANPIICSYPEGVKFLRDKVKELELSPEKLTNFLTKHMDVWVNDKEASYLNLDKWNICRGSTAGLKNKECYIGVDLSAKLDLTSIAFVGFAGKYIIDSHSFIPEEAINEKVKKDKIPYDVWEKQGWLTATPGAVTSFTTIVKYGFDYLKKNGLYCEAWCLDPWGGLQITELLQNKGETVIEISQGLSTLSEPTKLFREKVYNRELVHCGSPLLTWAVSNAVIGREDHNANIMISKKMSRGRIDPISAVMNAFVMAAGAEFEETYETMDMREL